MARDIATTVFGILKNMLEEPEGIIIDGDTDLATLGIESIEMVEAIFQLEEAFDITIPNPGESDKLDTEFKTAGDVVSAVEQLIAEADKARS